MPLPARPARPLALLALAGSLACASAPPVPTRPYEFRGSVEGGAGRLSVSDGGQGEPAVLFVHGLGSDLEAWRPELDRLRATRRAVAYDQRGHGASEKARDGVYTLDALADDLDRVVKTLGLRRVVLVGHSMSGAVITTWAGAHPEQVAALIYADAVGDFQAAPPAALQEVLKGDAAFVADPASRRRMYGEMLGTAARPATRAAVIATVDLLDPPAFPALRRGLFEFKVGDRLKDLKAPITAIEADGPPFPYAASKTIPGARRIGIAGVSHWLMLDDPAAFARAMDEALARKE
jgi:pimeloyl-ACP methyl ester carboxylesterase